MKTKVSVIVKIELDTIPKENPKEDFLGKYKEIIFKKWKKCLLGKYDKNNVFKGVPYDNHKELQKGDIISLHKKHMIIDREDTDFLEFELIKIIEEDIDE